MFWKTAEHKFMAFVDYEYATVTTLHKGLRILDSQKCRWEKQNNISQFEPVSQIDSYLNLRRILNHLK